MKTSHIFRHMYCNQFAQSAQLPSIFAPAPTALSVCCDEKREQHWKTACIFEFTTTTTTPLEYGYSSYIVWIVCILLWIICIVVCMHTLHTPMHTTRTLYCSITS